MRILRDWQRAARTDTEASRRRSGNGIAVRVLVRSLFMVALLAGCANLGVVDTWKGRTADDLSVAWGSPTSIQRLDNGGRVLNYEHTFFYGGTNYMCRAWFVTDPRSAIIDAKIQGANGACNQLLRGKPAGRSA